MPANICTAADYVTRLTGQGGRSASPRAAPSSSSSPTTSTRRGTSCPSTPRTASWRPRSSGTSRSRSRRFRTSCSSGGASAGTRCPSGAYFANYTQENHWNFTDILTDVRDNPRFLDLVVTPPGGSPGHGHPERLPELPLRLHQRTGQTIDRVAASWAARSSSPIGCAPIWACRVEYNDYVQSSENTSHVRPGRRPGHHLRQRDLRQQQLPPLHPRHHRLGRLAGAQLPGQRQLVVLRRGRARLQDAGARRVPERDGPGAGGPVRGPRGAVGRGWRQGPRSARVAFTVNGFYTKLKNIIGQGARRSVTRRHHLGHPATRRTTAPTAPRWRRSSRRCEGLQLQGSATILKAELGGGIDSLSIGERLALALPPRLGNLAALYYAAGGRTACSSRPTGTGSASRFSEDPVTRPLDNRRAAVLQLLQLRRGLRDSGLGDQAQHRSAERVPEQGTGGGQPAAGRRPVARRSSWPGRSCPAGCRRR